MNPDVVASCHGSLWLLYPTTDAAREWLLAHTDGLWHGDALAVEWRYVSGLVTGLRDAGFTVGRARAAA
jgi:hypothetical protein